MKFSDQWATLLLSAPGDQAPKEEGEVGRGGRGREGLSARRRHRMRGKPPPSSCAREFPFPSPFGVCHAGSALRELTFSSSDCMASATQLLKLDVTPLFFTDLIRDILLMFSLFIFCRYPETVFWVYLISSLLPTPRIPVFTRPHSYGLLFK